MKFKAVYLGRPRFVVNKNEKKKNDKIALKKSIQKYWYFSYFLIKTNVVGTH